MTLDDRSLRILFILISVIIISLSINFLSRKIAQWVGVGTVRGKRLHTLTNLVKSTSSSVLFVIALFMILREIGFDITPLLASAGIAGLAIGFGAQTLVKDILAGFFLLVEDQFDEGDEVEIFGKKGLVEKINLRTISLRDKSGVVHIIPNGSIVIVSNFSKNN